MSRPAARNLLATYSAVLWSSGVAARCGSAVRVFEFLAGQFGIGHGEEFFFDFRFGAEVGVAEYRLRSLGNERVRQECDRQSSREEKKCATRARAHESVTFQRVEKAVRRRAARSGRSAGLPAECR